MGRRAWLPWVGAIVTVIVVDEIGYPAWLAALAAVLVFAGMDEHRHRDEAPSTPIIQSRGEAWLFLASEGVLLAWSLLALVTLFVGEIAVPWLGFVITVAGFLAAQFLNAVRHRENGDSFDKRGVASARREAWALVRGGRQT